MSRNTWRTISYKTNPLNFFFNRFSDIIPKRLHHSPQKETFCKNVRPKRSGIFRSRSLDAARLLTTNRQAEKNDSNCTFSMVHASLHLSRPVACFFRHWTWKELWAVRGWASSWACRDEEKKYWALATASRREGKRDMFKASARELQRAGFKMKKYTFKWLRKKKCKLVWALKKYFFFLLLPQRLVVSARQTCTAHTHSTGK